MYHQVKITGEKKDPLEQKPCMEAIGKGVEEYKQKVEWLKKRWEGEEDSTAARIICPVLYLPTTHLHQAIIADNLEYFQKHYKPKKWNPNELLATACLCGSQQIADFLFKDLNKNYLSDNYEYVLAYVSASMNTKWAMSIAHTIAEAGKKMPGLQCLVDADFRDTLKEIFQTTKAKSTATKT